MSRGKRPLSFSQPLEDGELPAVEDRDGAETPPGQSRDGNNVDQVGDAADCDLYKTSFKRAKRMYNWSIEYLQLTNNRQPAVREESSDEELIDVRNLSPAAQRVADKRRMAMDRFVQQQSKRFKYGNNGLEQQKQQSETVLCRDVNPDDGNLDNPRSTASCPVQQVSCLMELGKALLTRDHLESFLEKPIFNETVTGCFVRISLGSTPIKKSPCSYCLSQIIAVKEVEQDYQMGPSRTNRVLQLQHGVELQNFQMNVVSNQAVTKTEFRNWVKACESAAQPLPTLSYVAEKEKDIKLATNYAFTERDVEQMVQTKQQAGKKPVSAAYRKVQLIMQRDNAVALHDLENASQLEQQIAEIDEKSRQDDLREKRMQAKQAVLAKRSKKSPTQIRSTMVNGQRHRGSKLKTIANLGQQGPQPVPQKEVRQPMPTPVASASAPAPATARAPASKEQQLVQYLDMLNLYELNNFKVKLDVSNLTQFDAIFKDD